MNLFKVANKLSFISETASYVINNFGEDLSNLKIILPSGYLCSYLQEYLTLRLETSLLPTIIPISELTTESEEAFKIPSNEIGSITKLEERIILAETVHSYKNLDYTIIQSLRLSPQLAHLFYELETNEITLEQLKDIPTVNQSLHWHFIYEFLIFANKNWQARLRKIGKLSRAKYQQVTFDAEIARLTSNLDHSILIAGINGNNIQTQKFIKRIAQLTNGHLIIPPSGSADPTNQTSPQLALFNMCRLLSLMNQKFASFKTLGLTKEIAIDKLIGSKGNNRLENKINYVEFDNIFDEAAYISSLIEQYVARNTNANIALILNNTQTKEIYTNFLMKYSIHFNDLIGIDLIHLNQISFILAVAELLCNDFSLKFFFNLLGNPLINKPSAIKLKNLLIKENRFASSFAQIIQIVQNTKDLDLIDWIVDMYEFMRIEITDNFHQILLQVIQISERLCPNIWQLNAKFRISEAVTEIIDRNWNFKIDNKEDFPDMLRGIIEGGRIFPQTTKSRVILCKASDVALMNFDHVIIADFSESKYPAVAKVSPWINRHMQDELGLQSELSKYGTSLYEFYLLLNNSDVLITRSKKQISGNSLIESHFLLRLKAILGDKLNKSIGKKAELTINNLSSKDFVIADFFPNQISITDIETLIRSPYNFYAKKILKLRSINLVEDSPNLAEFGMFFHKVAEQYTKNYNKSEKDKALVFTELSRHILELSIFPLHSKNHWQIKLAALAQDFIDFDEARRKNISAVYSEVRGSLKLKVAGNEIEIIGIADRIEIKKSGKAIILDYKTGAIPTKKDVLSGLSPQMIIGALIMMENGFGLGRAVTDVIVYVKIGSTKPYIDITEISLSKADLLHQKEGLIALLEYYSTEKKFQIEHNKMNYDDYSHLSRR